MRLTAAHHAFFKAALTDQAQNLFLIYSVILLACQMDQLKQQVIDVQVHRLPGNFPACHLPVELLNRAPDLHMVVLFHRFQQTIQTALAQHDPPDVIWTSSS